MNANKRDKKQGSNRQQASQQQLKDVEDQVKRGKANETRIEAENKCNARSEGEENLDEKAKKSGQPGGMI